MLGYCASILPIFWLIFSIQPSTGLTIECKPNMAHQTYPSPDGNPLIFFICEKGQGWIIKCPKESGFLATSTLHGCIPFKNWPNAPKDRIPSCSDGQHKRLYRHINPSMYFACKTQDTPILIKCPANHGFTYTKSVVGCVEWKDWKIEEQINDE